MTIPTDARPTFAVEASGLVKTFGSTRAVDGVDLSVAAGTVFGFLGPNGAGKTTTIKMLATLLRPDAGTARILGHDVVTDAATVRSAISLTGQHASVDDELTALENLVLLGRLLGLSRRQARARAGELLAAFDLAAASKRLVGKFSGGMRRRLDIAAGLVVRPDVMFLDEPTTGLDPRSRMEVWDVIRALVADGATVLLTTQYLEEADQLADRIAVIDHGRVIAEGTPGALKASVGAGALTVRLADSALRDAAASILAAALGVPVDADGDPAALSARVSAADRVAAGLAALDRQRIAVTTYALGQPTLDEVFLTLTGHAPSHDDVPDEGKAT